MRNDWESWDCSACKKRKFWEDLIVMFEYIKWTYRKDEATFFARMDNGFQLRGGRFRLNKKEIFYIESDETVEQVSQRSCGWLIIERIQGQVGQGFEQPDLEKKSLSGELGLHYL